MAKKLTDQEKLEYAKADLGYFLKQERIAISIKQMAIAKAICRISNRADLLRTTKRHKVLWLYKEKTIKRKFVNRALIHSVAYAKRDLMKLLMKQNQLLLIKPKFCIWLCFTTLHLYLLWK